MDLDQVLGTAGAKQSEKAAIKSDFYLKIGIETVDPETDELQFISLPQPLYLDTMPKSQIRGEGQFQEILCKGNDLLDEILAGARMHLKPGETKELNLKVILCHRKKSQEASHKKMSFNLFKA